MGMTAEPPSPDPLLCFDTGVRRRRTADTITIAEICAAPDSLAVMHAHDEAFLMIVFAGRSIARNAGNPELHYVAGSAYVHPPLHQHSVATGKTPFRAISIHLGAEWFQHLGGTARGVREVSSLFLPSLRLQQELSSWSAASPLVVEGLVLGLLGVIARDAARQEIAEPRWLPLVDAAMRFLPPRQLTVAELARRSGVHPVHLSRTWHRFRGSSIGDAIRRARIETACCRIAEDAPSLLELAREVGFADQTHFTRVFKQVAGMTPGAFRAALSEVAAHKPREVDTGANCAAGSRSST
jgi:AraC family transcriptional regulator